jgi:TRAP-type C4-dicarboxylate transport system substrate-binding protein
MSLKTFVKTSRVLFSFLLVFSIVSVSSIAGAASIQLRFSTSFMPFEPPAIYASKTLDLVEKKTNGQVKIKRFFGGAMGGPHEQLGLGKSGAVDIISLHIDQFTQQLPLHQVTNGEQLVSNELGLANVTALVHEIPETKTLLDAEQKKNNIKILHFYVNGPTGITTKVQANTLADLRGKRLNVITAYQRDVFKEMGWLPVNVKIPELYEALSRGMIDAIFMATAANIPLKWYEIGKQHIVLGQNTVVSAPLAFNLDSWNRLPADIQKAFWEASWEVAQGTVVGNDMATKGTYDKFKETGATIVKVSQDESDNFFTIAFKYWDANWSKVCKNAGVEKEAAVVGSYWKKMRWGKWKK